MTGKKAILVVSFGSTYADTREKNITAIEQAIAAQFPDFQVCRAFTGKRILKILRERDGLHYDNLEEALLRMAADGVRELIVQPTFVMNGIENDAMLAVIKPLAPHFESLRVGKTLLSDPEDEEKIARAMAEAYADLPEDTGLVLMGHGTDHYAEAIYQNMDRMFRENGYGHIFMVTMKGRPDFDDLAAGLEKKKIRKVLLVPFMVVAGKHACRDMTGTDGNSFESMLQARGYEVECRFTGLGEYSQVRDIYCQHVREVLQ